MGSFGSKNVLSDPEKVKKANRDLENLPCYSNLHKFKESMIVLTPSDDGEYLKARTRPYCHYQRGYPLIIAQPKSVNDVVKAMKFYTENCRDVTLCVCSGGHSMKSMISGTFVIDLQFLKETSVNPENKTITVGSGAYLKEIDNALEKFNGAVPIGTYPETGVGGLSMGGGFGFLGRKFGLTVDHMIGVEVVLPNGEVVFADETNEFSDLLWGCRGGGGNFGVVTKFTFRYQDLPENILGGFMVYLTPTLASAITAYKQLDSLLNKLTDDDYSVFVCPGGAPVTPSLWMHYGNKSSINDVPIHYDARNIAGPWGIVEDSVNKKKYHSQIQTILLPLTKSGNLYVNAMAVGNNESVMPEKFWEDLVTFTRASLPSTLRDAIVVCLPLGGQVASKFDHNTTTSVLSTLRKARFLLVIEAYWKDDTNESGASDAKAWVHNVFNICKPYKTETRYAAMGTNDEKAEDDRADGYIFGFAKSHGDDVIQRLRSIKTKYDPENILCNNVNIKPL